MHDLLSVFTLLDPLLQAVKEHYGRIASYYHAMKVIFEHSEITLDFSADRKTTQDGWEIDSRSYPTISRKDANQFARGQWIPECVLDVEWTKEPEQPTRLRHTVFLIGAKAPCNFIKLNLNPTMGVMQGQAKEDSQKLQNESTVKDRVTLPDEVSLDKLSLIKLPCGERVRIIETVAKDWRKVGCQLNFDRAGNQLDIIEQQKSNNPVACCEAMFQHWLNGNGVKPITWNKLIDILKDCEHVVLAQQVERAVPH